MKAIGVLLRWTADLWSILILALTGMWIGVYSGLFSGGSRWMALGYFPPLWFFAFFLPPVLVFLLQRQFKRAFLLVVIYVALFVSYGDISLVKRPAFRFAAGEANQKISMVALNLRYYSFGFEKIISAINELNADFYLLSENDITPKQVAEMKQGISPKLFFMGQNEGTAIISRYPILSVKEINLPSRQASLYDGNTVEEVEHNPFRSFVHAVADVNGVPLHVISIRFIAGRAQNKRFNNLLSFALYLLEAQRKEIAFFLDYIKQLEGPVIFGGDLNATPSSIVIRKLTDLSVDLYLQDHFWGGFTFGTSFPPKTNYPIARLDYLFGMNEVQPLRSAILPTVISDHYPVYAECLIPMKSNTGRDLK
jgi:endonuclease/exonuclease/phosphatase (EEP) superfamily protein YafD